MGGEWTLFPHAHLKQLCVVWLVQLFCTVSGPAKFSKNNLFLVFMYKLGILCYQSAVNILLLIAIHEVCITYCYLITGSEILDENWSWHS